MKGENSNGSNPEDPSVPNGPKRQDNYSGDYNRVYRYILGSLAESFSLGKYDGNYRKAKY
jgi:hypothetical protein